MENSLFGTLAGYILLAGKIFGIFVVIFLVLGFIPGKDETVDWGQTYFDIQHVYNAEYQKMEPTVSLESKDSFPRVRFPEKMVAKSVSEGVLYLELLNVQVRASIADAIMHAVSGYDNNEKFEYRNSLVENKEVYSAVVVKQNGKEAKYFLEAIPDTGLIKIKTATGDTANFWPDVNRQDLEFGSAKTRASVRFIERDMSGDVWFPVNRGIDLNNDPKQIRAALLEKCPEIPPSELITYTLAPSPSK